MAASSVVIKVKYGDTLRRFNAQIVGKEPNLTMDGLRKKIVSLFSFDPDTELILTYIDEDDDVVTLADDDDLRDVVKQDLDPLRITVKVKAENNGLHALASASSTPLISPRVQQPSLQNLNTGVPEILKTLPGPALYETLTKISADLASKASSSDFVQQPLQNLNTGVSHILGKVPEPLRESIEKISADLATKAKVTTELLSTRQSSGPGMTSELLVQHFSKLVLSLLDQLSQAQPGEGVTAESTTGAAETEDSDTSNINTETATSKVLADVRADNVSLEKPKPEATVDNEVEIKWSGGTKNEPSENVNGAHPGNDSLPNSGRFYPQSAVSSHRFGKKELLVKKILKKVNGHNVGKRTGSSVLPSKVPSLVNNSTCVGASDPQYGGFGKNAGPGPLPGNFNFPGLYYGFGQTYECPFSGLGAGDISAASLLPASEAGSFRRSNSQNDCGTNIFHRGVRCDGCGVHPITGPRFKSKVKVDYDLCSICFGEMGNQSDYIRMDRPAVFRHHTSFKGLHDARSREESPTFQQVHRSFKVKPVAAKLDSRFIQDVNIFDGTIMAPITPFTKIWRMRNNGTVAWPQKTQLVWIGGDKLSNELAVEVQIPAAGLMIDEELEVTVDFISPELPGRYISYWRMSLPSGQKFGQRVWVLIQVDSSLKEAPRENVRNLNLNLPPVSLTEPEIINVDPQPMIVGPSGAIKSRKVEEFVEPNMEQELKFPINDSLLVGDGATSSRPVSYPIIDMSDVAQAVQSVPPAVFNPLQPQAPPASSPPISGTQKSKVELPGKVEVEEMLLKELEEMGFNELDLNKKMLRMNEYDLEQAVDGLCEVAEWDPILEELQEMGFHDMATNKMLLKKNNGSIKRVVMDLIAGEKIE